jgi:alcohol dehydrogenase class IV
MPEFRLPGVIHFGWGALEKLKDEAPRIGQRALLVTGRSAMAQTGIGARVRELLEHAGVAVVPFSGVESDPTSATIDRGAAFARQEGCDLVIGLGGGSPMDAARAIAGLYGLEGSILDYVHGKPIDRPGLPLINIATTAGTASEITHVAVVSDEEKRLKFGVKSPYWFARVAITDPELTLTMPPALTASTGLDALSHAVESYLSTGAWAPAEALALRAIELIGRHLRRAVADGGNREARENMAMASMIAGMAFANTGLGLAHGFAHPLGSRHGLAHGVCCGRLLPHVMRYNAQVVPERIAVIGAALTGQPGSDSATAVDAVAALTRDVRVPAGMADLALPDDEVVSLAKDALLIGAVKTNPQPVTEEDSIAVLRAAVQAK